MRSLILLISCTLGLVGCHSLTAKSRVQRDRLDLSGKWAFQLDPDQVGVKEQWFKRSFNDEVQLPGTTDTNRKGWQDHEKHTHRLTRPFHYEGAAWYQREITIPTNWSGKQLQLFLERTKATEVWFNGKNLGQQNALSTPHIYDLGTEVKPGRYQLAIKVDNRLSQFPAGASHALADSTQGNWNGIIGKIHLIARPRIALNAIHTFPKVSNQTVDLKIEVTNTLEAPAKGEFLISAAGFNGHKHQVKPQRFQVALTGARTQTVTVILAMGADVALWDEFSPNLYKLNVSFKTDKGSYDQLQQSLAMVDFKAVGRQFEVNGKRIQLRGRHDACVFPLTGHPPMDLEGWLRYMTICKEYGMNHVRYHTWCPPEAAFMAADLVGIYMQPEIPNWTSFNRHNQNHLAYQKAEGLRIMDFYGNYGSFRLFALGNELGGDIGVMEELVAVFKEKNPRALYCQGSNNMFWDPKPRRGEEFFVSARTKKPQANFSSDIRASFSRADCPDMGWINARVPSTRNTFSAAIEGMQIPAIGHETGQYQVYPDFKEIRKYTGSMQARSLEVFRDRLKEKGLLHLADAYFKNSGAHAVNCYKEDIEACLRTPDFGGFQILDLQDFPGQGTALVGILDAFLDSKGLITPQAWREFCAPQTVQANMDKRVWAADESFVADVNFINYGPKAISGRLHWELLDDTGRAVKEGKLETVEMPQGKITAIGRVAFPLNGLQSPTRFTLLIKCGKIQNRYAIWVYPSAPSLNPQGVVQTEQFDQAIKALKAGKKVLYTPTHAAIAKQSLPGLFITDYWNYPMFKQICERAGKPVSPGTLGLLIRDKHPLFRQFPTASHTDWQWWSIVMNSRAMNLDKLDKNIYPIVQPIDNFQRNAKLGLLLELKVGPGKLMLASTNFNEAKDPAARQYHHAILQYMNSDEFNPNQHVTAGTLSDLLFNQPLQQQGDAKDFEDNADRTSGYDKVKHQK